MKKIIITLVASILFMMSAVALAHSGATGIVKERMDQMELMKNSMKELKPYFRGKLDVNGEVIKSNALMIRDNAAENMTTLFPKGSLQKPSEAKPEIWQEWQQFVKYANDLQDLAQELHDSLDTNDKLSKESKSIFKQIADNCSDCHKTYKREK